MKQNTRYEHGMKHYIYEKNVFFNLELLWYTVIIRDKIKFCPYFLRDMIKDFATLTRIFLVHVRIFRIFSLRTLFILGRYFIYALRNNDHQGGEKNEETSRESERGRGFGVRIDMIRSRTESRVVRISISRCSSISGKKEAPPKNVKVMNVVPSSVYYRIQRSLLETN